MHNITTSLLWFQLVADTFRRLMQCCLAVAALIVLTGYLWPGSALAQDQDAVQPPDRQPGQIVVSGLTDDNALRVEVGRTGVLQTGVPVTEISVGNPAVAEINLLSPQRILVTGLSAGTTQLLIFSEDQSQIVDVRVEVDITGLRSQLDELFPDHAVIVRESKGRIVISGEAPNLETAAMIVQVATPYGEVLNFLNISGGQQIMLQVIFAEVSRSATTQLGVNFGISGEDAFGGSNIGGLAPLGVGDPGDSALGGVAGVALQVPDPAGTGVTLFGVGQAGDVAFAGFISALRDNNLMRVLAKPDLVALSGETASFLAGGEFPIPVAQAGGTGASTVTIEFREFGVKLDFIAVALGDGRIRLQANPEVSDVDFSNAVQFGGFIVPGLTQRKVTTTVELADGQSLAIAGLLDHNITANKSTVPILGDIPILGSLFRSVRYQRRETELIVFVTPRLVSPMNPGEIPAVPGQRWVHPTEAELFWLGNLGQNAAETKKQGDGAPLFYGPYGFSRAPAPQEPQ